jgi:hypothetical protein
MRETERQMSADVLTEMLREVAPERLIRSYRGVTVEGDGGTSLFGLGGWQIDLRCFLNGQAIAYRQTILQEYLDNAYTPSEVIAIEAAYAYEKIKAKIDG